MKGLTIFLLFCSTLLSAQDVESVWVTFSFAGIPDSAYMDGWQYNQQGDVIYDYGAQNFPGCHTNGTFTWLFTIDEGNCLYMEWGGRDSMAVGVYNMDSTFIEAGLHPLPLDVTLCNKPSVQTSVSHPYFDETGLESPVLAIFNMLGQKMEHITRSGMYIFVTRRGAYRKYIQL